MRSTATTFAAALALTLAACGSSPADQPKNESPAPTDTAGVPAAAATPSTAADPAATPSIAAVPSAAAVPTATPSIAAIPNATAAPAVAAAKPAAFAQCAVCHSVEPGKSGLGPSLAGVLGSKAGSAAGFAYSPAIENSGLTWDEATLDRFLTAPMKTVPGTKMSYGGMADAAQRKAVIGYLKTLK